MTAGATAELYRRYAPHILRRARAILGQEEEARDATHEVFMKALDHEADLAKEPSPMTWLYRVTTNHCIDILRVRGRRSALLAEHAPALADGPSGPSDEARMTLRRVLERVPDDLKEVAIHFFVDEMTQDEIATHLGCARRTVGYRLERFRQVAAAITAELHREVAS